MHIQSLTGNTLVEFLGDTYGGDSSMMENKSVILDLMIELDAIAATSIFTNWYYIVKNLKVRFYTWNVTWVDYR